MIILAFIKETHLRYTYLSMSIFERKINTN